ncbi:MAG: 4Fe-4S dicluster domain-containing protein [Actinomycetota bacterium]|nr:4Fe-4S dicluster domain-containing protein [Actinomycetota bacterium]
MTISTSTTFGGLALKNPVVIASAPPTETLQNLLRCEDAGAAAVVTKTLADFPAASYPLGARRAHVDRQGMWALSTFRRETLTLDEGTELISEAYDRMEIPIIASVGATSMDPTAWLRACLAAEQAGASMIQIDLFYSPHPRCSPENVRLLLELLEVLHREVRIPLAPKLNIELPAAYAAQLLPDTGIAGVFAIDSLRTPVPLDARRGGHPLTKYAPNAPETSLFGPWQKPVTLQYASTLVRESTLSVCAGGGLMTGWDAAEAIMLGASSAQFATAVIRHGYKRIESILEQLTTFMDRDGYTQIDAFQGSAIERTAEDEASIDFVPTKAVVDTDACTMCGLCTELVFCPDIRQEDGRIRILDHCDGCGLCVAVCPPKISALRLT